MSALIEQIELNNKKFQKALAVNDRRRIFIAQENTRLISELVQSLESEGLTKAEIREKLISLQH